MAAPPKPQLQRRASLSSQKLPERPATIQRRLSMTHAPEDDRVVYELPLTDSGAPDVPGTYIYLPPPTEPPYLVRFRIEGTSSICRHGSLWVNVPSSGEDFDRNVYREYKLEPDFNRAMEIDIPILSAGAFAFYTTFSPLPDLSAEAVAPPTPTQSPTYYIDVSPKLVIKGEKIPLDSLIVFSVISKLMGDFPAQWDKHLHGIAERGYNMVHFTPMMTRGESNSPYSIFDQLQFDKDIFKKGEADIASLIHTMEDEHGLLAMTDVVWNHTANNSKWLEEHPEAGYNARTAPWLTAAIELDAALLDFSARLESLDLPTVLSSNEDLQRVMAGVKPEVFNAIKLWEFYAIDVDRDVEAAVERWMSDKSSTGEPLDPGDNFDARNWSLEERVKWLSSHGIVGKDRMGERHRRRIDPDQGALLMKASLADKNSFQTPAMAKADGAAFMRALIDATNVDFYREYDADCTTIKEQLSNRIKYMRLDDNGPKMGKVTKTSPLTEPYFTRLPKNETTKAHPQDSLAVANNGWIWAADVLKDHAGPESRAYLRREVIVWGDCVKLRYGASREENPWLWDYMAKYTRLMAKYFAGFRIDNCHSTPLPVAEHMLDEARKVRPNLVVCAELFSGNEAMDFLYVERLGLSCLIREAMQAWNTQEMSRLVHKHAGRPIGSFELNDISGSKVEGDESIQRERILRIRQSPVHALFMDCTHDNEVPTQKRDARDTLPNAALVAMCACATGSVMGYDELYPRLIELVQETRPYTSPFSKDAPILDETGPGGIGGVKQLLNRIHVEMGQEEYDETFVEHSGEYITIHRVHPQTHHGYFLIAHTAYPGHGNGNAGFPPVRLDGTNATLIGAWRLEADSSPEAVQEAVDDETLRGIPCEVKAIEGVTVQEDGDCAVISVPSEFPPGSIALLQTFIPSIGSSNSLDSFVTRGADAVVEKLSLSELNFLLYRCDPEEREITGEGIYDVPGHGALVYGGLQGWWSVLENMVRNNNLGHALANHLRDGHWAMEYCVKRLEVASKRDQLQNLAHPARWLQSRFDAVREAPSFLHPRYFTLVIQTCYKAALGRCMDLMHERLGSGQQFLQHLSLVGVQVGGLMFDTGLWPEKKGPSLAAGLPHFSSSWARCWGRDIFISLRGLYLVTGQYDTAREHILAFASVLKHGMIPNLLSNGKQPRYNARDSIWFFLQAIQDYVEMAPEGKKILSENVKRRFLPSDDTYFEWDDARAYSKSSTIEEIIQEALQRHATGMKFREHNAGPDLDRQMKSEGFDQDIYVDWSTGLLFGGSQTNCGTWMDKMGESEKSGSKGVPGTPRDGAAVEIIGLLYSTLKWVAKLHKSGAFKLDRVDIENGGSITFDEWAGKIRSNFERCYYVPESADQDSIFDVNSAIVNRRGIYKDLYKSGKEYEDYQLRPNFAIAMTVAPDLFDPAHALNALTVADDVLRGPYGMATLDPSDLNYRPYYNNDEDSSDFHTAKGRNYHQGPEWIWPLGYFLRALLHFDLKRRKSGTEQIESFQQITRRLEGCRRMIKESPWAGLTELTNKDGAYCKDSCPTQAWSTSCLLDVFHDAEQYSRANEVGK